MDNKIEVTESAQNHISDILNTENSKFFRVTVLGGGCSGFQYKFDFSKNINDDDIVFEYKKIKLIVDNTSIELIKGSKIDYVNELIGSSFKITNPQASSSCGCGTSFSIQMKITTWNVNSINARIEHLIKFIKKDQSDIYLIQELKCTNETFPEKELENINYKSFVNGQKAWNGVAFISKKKLEISNFKIPNYNDENSRLIETDIKLKNIKNNIKLINIYLPNGNPIETNKFDYKIEWMKKFNEYIKKLINIKTPIIIGGDFNVIPNDEDVYSPENFKNDACAHPITREYFRKLLNLGFVDTVKFFIEGSSNILYISAN